MIDKIKKMIIVILFVYILVFVSIYITKFILNQYGLEYRSNVETFCVFWKYKLSFVAVAFLLFFIFLSQKEKRRNDHEESMFRIIWTLVPITYIIASGFLLILLALGGFLDIPREETLETGYLKITELTGLHLFEYYYCEPISEYVRKPVTSSSYVINPEYE